MHARSIIIELMANGYTRKQIAKSADITSAAVSHILNGKTKKNHPRTLLRLIKAYQEAVREAQKRLRATQTELADLQIHRKIGLGAVEEWTSDMMPVPLDRSQS